MKTQAISFKDDIYFSLSFKQYEKKTEYEIIIHVCLSFQMIFWQGPKPYSATWQYRLQVAAKGQGWWAHTLAGQPQNSACRRPWVSCTHPSPVSFKKMTTWILYCAKRLHWNFSNTSKWTKCVYTWIKRKFPGTSNRSRNTKPNKCSIYFIAVLLCLSGSVVHRQPVSLVHLLFYFSVSPTPAVPCPFSCYFLFLLYLVDLWSSFVHLLV